MLFSDQCYPNLIMDETYDCIILGTGLTECILSGIYCILLKCEINLFISSALRDALRVG